MSDFPSFDTLLRLAKEKPEELEKFRQEQVESIINQAPEGSQRRLRGLQFQIDAQRKLHSDSPMGACLKISQMMHESFSELRVWLNDITGVNDPLRNEMDAFQSEPKIAAKVIHFPAS
ncbi:MAG: DUF3135 domain-containing protein [Cellvibrionaceae bacterium]